MEQNKIRKFSNREFYDSAKKNGYTSTDTAICEIIDNSIESYDEINKKNGLIEIFTIEERTGGSREKITEIIIADSAGGMTDETLMKALAMGQGTKSDTSKTRSKRKLGKFGFGLLNSSISQCDRVDVFSWKNKEEIHYTYEDLEEYRESDEANESQFVNQAKKTEFPDYFHKLLSDEIIASDHGTIVSWKKMTDNTWKTRLGFVNNVEFELGRIFRHMINDGSIRLIIKPVSKIAENRFEFHDEIEIKPNDPLHIMGNNSLKKPWNEENIFKLVTETPLEFKVEYTTIKNGEEKKISGNILINFSYCDKRLSGYQGMENFNYLQQSVRFRNQGISVVREGREIELNRTWLKSTEPRDRWVAGEVKFDSSLDDFMGIDNQKQACTNFKMRSIAENADSFNMSQAEYLREVNENDVSLGLHLRLTQLIDKETNRLTTLIRQQGDGKGTKRGAVSAEAKATEAIRKAKAGKTSGDSEYDNSTDSEKKAGVVEVITSDGFIDEETARQMADKAIKENSRFIFISTKSNNPWLFDVEEKLGILHISINENHPAYDGFYKIIESKSDETEDSAKEYQGVKLLLAAWARLESQADENSEESYQYQKARSDWGDLIRVFMKQEIESKEDSN